MRIIKIIETGLNIDDPISMYSNAQANFMSMLTNQFKGVCIRECRIEKILQIKKISECIMETRGEQCIGHVNIMFEVEATVYAPGEVISGCLVQHKDQNLIVVKHPTASIWLKYHEKLASIKAGQFIPIVVGGASYTLSSNSISINAVPFLPTHNSICYKIEGSLTTEDRQLLSGVIERLETEERKLKEVRDAKAVEFFNKLIYPFKAEFPLPEGAQVINIRQLLEAEQPTRWCVRDKRIKPTEPTIHVYNEENPPESEFITLNDSAGIQFAITAILEDYIQNLRIVREFTEVYSDEKLITSHSNLWKIFYSIKK